MVLDAFGWADEARDHWAWMTVRERQAVVAAAKAERASNDAYVQADKATERAVLRAVKDAQSQESG